MSEVRRARCAFLTMTDRQGYTIDDELALAPLGERGILVDTLAWNQEGIDWSRYGLVVVRSTWDYQHRIEAFLARLAEIEASGARLQNDLDLMRWNLDKRYLRDLAEQAVPTIPTLWLDRLPAGALASLFDELQTEVMILKPQVGAGAHGAWKLTRDNLAGQASEIEAFYGDRTLMAQPFVPSVESEGEISLIFFEGHFSHALQKLPKTGDFRSQEEFGSRLTPLTPEPELLSTAELALATLSSPPLYARVDLLRSPTPQQFWLIELELVEPSLYLSLDPQAPTRFAEAITHQLLDRGPGRQGFPRDAD